MDGNYKIFNDLSKVYSRSTNLLILSLASMFCCALFSIYIIYKTNESVKNRFYLLDNGQKLATVRIDDPKRALHILCEGHVRNFHELFFSLEPDLRFIKRNIEGKALYMIDYARYPFSFRFVGKQKITKDGDTEFRNLVTTGYITETKSTPNNLNGLKIVHFNVVDNNDL